MKSSPENTAVISPFYNRFDIPGRANLLKESISTAQTFSNYISVVDDGSNIINDNLNLNVDLIKLPENRGKIYASKIGIKKLLKRENIKYFIVSDFDREQDQKDIPLLTQGLDNNSDVVIGNRYGFFNSNEIPDHRIAVNKYQMLISQQLGYRVTDLMSGLIGANRKFAKIFTEHSKNHREGIGLDWLILSYLHKCNITNIPIHAQMRSEKTNADKLLINLKILINYKNELIKNGKQNLIELCETIYNNIEKQSLSFSVSLRCLNCDKALFAKRINNNYSFEIKELQE